MPNRAEYDRMDYDELAHRAGLGEEDACEALARRLGADLLGFLVRCGLSQPDAEDLAVSCVGDVVLELQEGRFESRGAGAFKAWVFKLARNRLTDQRRKRREQLLGGVDCQLPLLDEPEGRRSPGLLDRALDESLARLSEVDREIIELRNYQPANSFGEIGEILGISQQAAKGRYYRALKHLEAVLVSHEAVQLWLEGKPTEQNARGSMELGES